MSSISRYDEVPPPAPKTVARPTTLGACQVRLHESMLFVPTATRITFCATTLARGSNRSRPTTDLIAEAAALSETHREIVLTGSWVTTRFPKAGEHYRYTIEGIGAVDISITA